MADAAKPRRTTGNGGDPFNETGNSSRRSGQAQPGYNTAAEADIGAALLMDFYTRAYPTVEELTMDLDDIEEGELAEIVAELRAEVDALREETGVFEYNVAQIHSRAHTTGNAPKNSSNSAINGVDGLLSAISGSGTRAAASHGSNSNGGPPMPLDGATDGANSSITSHPTRRGQDYRRKSQEDADVLVSVSDKMVLLAKEEERLEQQEERASRQAAQVNDLLTATVEESQRRLKELRLEFRQFCREVLKYESDGGKNTIKGAKTSSAKPKAAFDADDAELPDGATALQSKAYADDLLVYMRRRVQSQKSYLDKLTVQCSAAEQDISRAQQRLRQRKAAGEAFNAVDFAQLRIENEQFNERIEKKNAELAELKGTSTRAVQTLNTLMDALNELNAEQTQLKKELKSRGEYLSRCAKEVTVVSTEAAGAERKNQTIKAQHEAVKVPKIEEYIAQTAELFELQKAFKNWTRKVEIAEGQVKVLRRQTKKLNEQQEMAVAYAEARRKKRIAAALTSTRRVTAPSAAPGAAAAATAAATTSAHPSSSSAQEKQPQLTVTSSGGKPAVGGSKALLQSKSSNGTGAAKTAPPGNGGGAETAQPAKGAAAGGSLPPEEGHSVEQETVGEEPVGDEVSLGEPCRSAAAPTVAPRASPAESSTT